MAKKEKNMRRKRSTKIRSARGNVQERTVPLGYIGNPASEPPPQTIEIPEAFRPPRVSSESSRDESKSSSEGSDN